MARRVRRDLSNKTIRKFIYESLKTGRGKSKNFWKTSYIRSVFYFLFILLIVILVTQSFNLLDIKQFFNSKSPQNIPEFQSQPSTTLSVSQEQVPLDISAEKKESHKIRPVKQKIQIEVLNGCGIDGIALKTTEFCRKNNLDVVYMGNYKNFNEKFSRVIGWENNRTDALKIAQILGIDESHISVEKNNKKQLAASVIIGADYKKLKPFKQQKE